MGIPTRTGPNSIVVRQDDIVVPLFDPSYTINLHNAAITPDFARFSLFPLYFSAATPANSATFSLVDAYTFGPFGAGRVLGNPGNEGTIVGATNGNLRGLLYANLCFGIPNSVNGGNMGYAVLPLTAAGEIDIGVAVQNEPIIDTSFDFAYGAMMVNLIERNVDNVPGFAVARAHNDNNTYWYGFPTDNVGTMQALGAYWSIFGNNFPVTSIPGGSTDPNTYMIFQDIISNDLLRANWQFNNVPKLSTGYAEFITFDNPTIDSIYNGWGGNTFHSSFFGHLIGNNNTSFYAGEPNYMLISPNGKFYSLLRFMPIGHRVQTEWPVINQPIAIDNSGVLYLQSATSPADNSAMVIYNSYSLTIPWQPVTVPTLNLQGFVVPGLCGCQPTTGLIIPST